MKLKYLMLFTLILISILPVVGQEITITTHAAAFNDYSFRYPDGLAVNIRITTHEGDALDQPALTMAGWEPAYAQFDLYNDDNYRPELQMRLSATADLVGYPEEDVVLKLQTLLTERPDLNPFEDITTLAPNPLSILPLRGAAQILIARAEYVETDTFIGIRYVTVYAQDMYPLTNESFRYVFIGVSKDGSTYVWLDAVLHTDLFPDSSTITPSDIEEFYLHSDDDYRQGIEIVNAAPASAFTPNLDELESLLTSIRINDGGE